MTQYEETEKLVEIWRVLVALSVSMDRLGAYNLVCGEEAAKDAVHQFFGAEMFQRISKARGAITTLLIERDPTIEERLEAIGDNEMEMGYWNGPKTRV